MNSVPNESLKYTLAHADQIGGAKVETHRRFIDQVDSVREVLSGIGLEIEFAVVDMSAERRHSDASKGDTTTLKQEISDSLAETDQYGIKLPTETTDVSQLFDRLQTYIDDEENYPYLFANQEGFNEEQKAAIKLALSDSVDLEKSKIDPRHIPRNPGAKPVTMDTLLELGFDEHILNEMRKSPNDILRNLIEAAAILRRHQPMPNLYENPKVSRDLDIRTIPNPETFFVENPDGTFGRSVDASVLEAFATELVISAAETGKPIVVAGKFTISPLDSKLLDAVMKAANAYNRSNPGSAPIKVIKQISDSALPGLTMGKFGGQIIACLPDNYARFKPFQELSGQEYLEPKVYADAMKTVSVYRCATGFGYGEEVQTNNGTYKESYSLDPKVVRDTARLALKEYKEDTSRPITVVLPVDGHPNHPLNLRFQTLVNAELEGNSASYLSNAEMHHALLTNPAHDFGIVICGNSDGDHITDFYPGLQVGKLKDGVLGVGTSCLISVNEDGTIRTIIAEASAGTAPRMDNPKNANQVNPYGILVAILELIEKDDRILDPKIKEKVTAIKQKFYDIMNSVEPITDFSDIAYEAGRLAA